MQLATTDVCVIGAGIAGREVAAIACEAGAQVLLIDPRVRYTYPSASLPVSELLEHGSRSAGELRYATQRQLSQSIEFTVSAYRAAPLNGRSIATIQGIAKFVDPRTVEAAGILIRPKSFVLAVGPRPFLPTTHKLNSIPYSTAETIHRRWHSLTDVVVVGGGPTGVELSQDIRRMGARVRLVTAGPILIPEDRDATDLVRASLKRQGIELLEYCGLRYSHLTDGGLSLHVYGHGGHTVLECSDLVIATGRRPALETLNLEAGNIREGMKGIIVDDTLRTTNPHCYAAGDCIGSPMSGHGAARLVAENILRSSTRRVPRVVYGQVELAQLGDTETKARRALPGLVVMRGRLSGAEPASDGNQADGLIKVMIANGKVVGVTIASPRASEAIAPWCVAFGDGMEVAKWPIVPSRTTVTCGAFNRHFNSSERPSLAARDEPE